MGLCHQVNQFVHTEFQTKSLSMFRQPMSKAQDYIVLGFQILSRFFLEEVCEHLFLFDKA